MYLLILGKGQALRKAIFSVSIAALISLLLFPNTSWCQLADSPWPMFHHDEMHTGLSDYVGPQTGTLSWSYVIDNVMYSSPSIGSDGRIYVGHLGTSICALNPTGSLAWTYETLNMVFSSPAIGSDGKVYMGSWDYSIYAITSTGSLFWSYVTGGDVYSSPAIGSYGMIYVGSFDNNLYALASTGLLSWSYVTQNRVWSSPAIGSDATVYVGSEDYSIYAFSSTGSFFWSYVTGGYVDSSPAISSDGRVYIGSWDDTFYVLDSTGSLSWSYVTGFLVRSSPAIDSDGTIYVGSSDNSIYSLISTGSLLWSYVTGGDLYSSPAIGSDRRVYIGSEDTRLYVLEGPPAAKLAIMKKEGVTDTNLYYYNSLEVDDWTYWDALTRNPSALARDFWQIPSGNDAIGVAAVQGSSPDNLYVLKKEGADDINLYFYNSLLRSDWTYWDALARNPSALARDFWIIPAGNDAVGITSVDDVNGDTRDDLAILTRNRLHDVNLYYYNALVPGDWTYWDVLARNPSAIARDFWIIPAGNDAASLTELDLVGVPSPVLAIIKQQGAADVNFYVYNNLVTGDWTYWDALARNPSALARDFWFIPSGNDTIDLTGIDVDGDDVDELALIKGTVSGSEDVYYYNAPAPGNWTYWDCNARNPSPLARDFWMIPSGNDAIGMSAIKTQ